MRGIRGAAARREDASPQLGLFSPPAPSALEQRIAEVDPDALSPREALQELYRLKALS